MPLLINNYQQSVLPQSGSMSRVNQPPQLLGLGDSLSGLADTAGRISRDYNEEIAREERARQAADLHDRIGRATNDLDLLQLDYERDQNFQTSPQRFKEDAGKIKERYLSDVKNPAVRQAFTQRFGEIELAKSLNVLKDSRAKERNYYQASLSNNIDVYARSAANAKNLEERDLVIEQAGLAIASAQQAGFITSVEAQSKLKTVRSKIDEQTILRDLSIDPILTANKLALDPNYASNLDPVQKERYTDQAYRRSESQRLREEVTAERDRKKRGDDLLKEAFNRQQKGTLTDEYVEQVRFFIEPNEYKSLKISLRGGAEKDDPKAYADLESLLYSSDPVEARSRAFQYHSSGLITNSTLGHFSDKANALDRQGGPKTQYERSRSYLVDTLKPSPTITDPVPAARMAVSLREFDDYVATGKRTDEEISKKADEILKRRSLVDMVSLVEKTGIGTRQIKDLKPEIVKRVEQLNADLAAKRITVGEYNKRKDELNRQRKAVEKLSE